MSRHGGNVNESVDTSAPWDTVSPVLDREKMKRLREQFGLTQLQASKLAGFRSRQHWNNVENGQTSPTLTTLDRIAKALNCSARDLLTK